MYSPKSAGEKRLILVILLLSGLILLALSIFYLLNPRPIVGDALVNSPSGNSLEVPPPGTFFFYLKPVTILFGALVVFSFCGFTLLGGVISRISRSVRALLLLVSVLFLAVSAYEVLFNFTLWAALISSTQSNPDSIVNAYPVSAYKINLAFATKSFVALLFISYFALTTFKNSIDSSNS